MIFGNYALDIVAKFRAAIYQRLIYLGIKVARSGVAALTDEKFTGDGRKDYYVLFALLRSFKMIFKYFFRREELYLEEIEVMHSLNLALAEKVKRSFTQYRGDKHTIEANVFVLERELHYLLAQNGFTDALGLFIAHRVFTAGLGKLFEESALNA